MRQSTKQRVEQLEQRAGVTGDRVEAIRVLIHGADGELVKVRTIQIEPRADRLGGAHRHCYVEGNFP